MEEKSQDRQEYVSYIAHEARLPLLGVDRLLQQMLLSEDRDEEKLQLCKDNVARVAGFLTRMLEGAQKDSASESLQLEAVSMEEFVRLLEAYLKPLAQEKQIALSFSWDSCYEYYYMDRERMLQIVSNLIHNAIKYTQSGGFVRVSLKGIRQEECRVSFQVQVDDNGRGMSEEFQKRIFLPFEQEESSSRDGVGLGMAITRRLLNLVGGDIQITSAPGRGTSVRVCVDMDASDEQYAECLTSEEGERTEREKLPDDSFLAGRKILLAENDEMYSQLVLMDLEMPDMDGRAAAGQIRASGHPDAETIPIYAFTGHETDEVFLQENRMQGAVPKIFEERALLQGLKRVMESK